jgi:hypothetical protein
MGTCVIGTTCIRTKKANHAPQKKVFAKSFAKYNVNDDMASSCVLDLVFRFDLLAFSCSQSGPIPFQKDLFVFTTSSLLS